ncbi:nucleotidyltransferase family protein [uncultured Ramlibacter sp.]|uniref:nucleotidyltransferase family protein n=1 Tax=uncultured Ramlibacter sp. TaxID=260755 RepID=UPI00260EE4D8|nr:nucleotidyltransferase family protein [uncultured Ramlibacter sp.]
MSGAQAMVLAAGRGERMRPLTDTCPKPLLQVQGKPLLQYHLEALARAGFSDVVVNTAWLGEQIENRFALYPPADGPEPLSNSQQPRIHYSREGRDFGGALETAGGIARALPLLDEVFWLAGGDVYVPGFAFSRAALERFAASGKLAHLLLVANPLHNPKGDFGLRADGLALNTADTRYTYSTLGLYRKTLFAGLPGGNPDGIKAPLAPLLRAAMDNGQVTAEVYSGAWTDVGTPERLAQLNAAPSRAEI